MTVGHKLRQFLGEKLIEHQVLRDFTSIKVGGVADFYFPAETLDELIKAIIACQKVGIDFFILGSGCNILISDIGFGGLVIHNKTSNLAFLPLNAQVIVDSGATLSHLILEAAAKDLSGLEALFGIPGTIGGAVYNNAGAFGVEIGSLLKSATLWVPARNAVATATAGGPDQPLTESASGRKKTSRKGKIIRCHRDWFEFSYRASRLKSLSHPKPVILSVKLQLSCNKKEEVMRRIADYQKIKRQRQPLGELTCGSIFKNPSSETSAKKITDPTTTAGYLLEQAGAKKLKVGQAYVSSKHANWIINRGRAKAIEIRQLISQMQDLVRQQTGIILEEEIEYVGEW